MIKEFNNETQAKAIADSLGLFITKYKGVYIVSTNEEELLANYGLGYYQEEDIFMTRKYLRLVKMIIYVLKIKRSLMHHP